MPAVRRTLAIAALLMLTFAASGSSLVAQQSDERSRAADANEAKLKNCNLYPPQETSPYVLPWEPGTERLVWRGREHFARGNGGVGLYAYDFEMPLGTRLVAVRSGEVAAVREEFKDGNGEDL